MTAELCFNEVAFSPVIHQDSLWIRATELARALGYKREDQVAKIYRNNADEFTPDMTQVIEIVENAEMAFPVKVRIFSLRGCHLLAMFARTPVAKEFRRWVLDVLEEWESGKSQSGASTHPTPLPSKIYTLPAEPYQRFSTAQMQALRSAHKAWAEEVTYNNRFKSAHSTWLILKGHFGGVTRLTDLPSDWFLDIIEFCHAQQEKELERRRARRALPTPAPALPPVSVPRPNYDVPWGNVPKTVSDAARQAADLALPLNSARHTAVALASLIEQARETLDALRVLSALEVK